MSENENDLIEDEIASNVSTEEENIKLEENDEKDTSNDKKKDTSKDVKKQEYKLGETANELPEHGPIDPVTGKEILLSLKNVDITFGKGDRAVRAVKNASFDIYKGETFSLVGESGSGKTTVGRAVIRVNPLANGEIDYKGVRISGKIPHSLDRQVIRNIQMVFQDPAASLNERATVEYIVSEGLYNFKLFNSEAERIEKVENIIKEVGLLPEHLTRYPHEFSGGQRQRIGIARALASSPEFIMCDEPVSALDVSIQAQILNTFQDLQKQFGLTYLFVAHNLLVVKHISDRIAVMYLGHIVELANSQELYDNPLHPYTISLLSSIPEPDPNKARANKRQILEGDIPSPLKAPSGCPFRTRCPKATPECANKLPELREISKEHFVACRLFDE